MYANSPSLATIWREKTKTAPAERRGTFVAGTGRNSRQSKPVFWPIVAGAIAVFVGMCGDYLATKWEVFNA